MTRSKRLILLGSLLLLVGSIPGQVSEKRSPKACSKIKMENAVTMIDTIDAQQDSLHAELKSLLRPK